MCAAAAVLLDGLCSGDVSGCFVRTKEMSPTSSGQLSPTIESSLESNSPCSSEPTEATPPLLNGVKVMTTSCAVTTGSNPQAPPPLLGPSVSLNSGLRCLPFASSASDHLSLFSDNTFSHHSFKPVESSSTPTGQWQFLQFNY